MVLFRSDLCLPQTGFSWFWSDHIKAPNRSSASDTQAEAASSPPGNAAALSTEAGAQFVDLVEDKSGAFKDARGVKRLSSG